MGERVMVIGPSGAGKSNISQALRSGRHTCMGFIVNYAKEVEQCPLP